MRYLFTSVLFLATTFSIFAQNNKGYVIKGTVKGLKNGKVYLMYKDDNGKTQNEICTVADGYFEFKGQVTEPRHCYISLDGQVKPGEFFAENAQITINFDKSSPETLTVKGSPATDLFVAFKNSEKDVTTAYASLEDVYLKAIVEDNKGLMQYADSVKATVNARHREYLKTFCLANPKSIVAEYLVMRTLEVDRNLIGVQSVYATLDPSLSNNYYGKMIANKLQSVTDVATDKTDADFTTTR